MKQRIDKLLGIQYPIIQGGMAWVSDASLAAAVSNAGGLGVIAAGNAPASWVKEQIIALKEICDKPFGVNVMLLSPFADEIAQLVVELEVPVVFTGAGNPRKYIDSWKEAGIKILPVVANKALAQMMQKMGADGVVAEGSEAGGHIGELGTLVLVPMIVDAVDIPVVAAGGICDARTTVAAFALGADGVQVGTRFILAEECTAHDNYKSRVIRAKDVDSRVTGRVTGHPVRLLRNNLTRELAKLEYSENGAEKIEEIGAGSLRIAVVEGDLKEGSFMAGQCACRMDKVEPAKDIISNIFDHDMVKQALKLAQDGTKT
ncbi:MAG: nitronate monooxygenase [Clostridiales bacterium]|nr:nitronate monooxygenase [Clostridiales bacterium]